MGAFFLMAYDRFGLVWVVCYVQGLFVSLYFDTYYSLLTTRAAGPVRRTVTGCSCRATLVLVSRRAPAIPLLCRGKGTLGKLNGGLRTLDMFRRIMTRSSLGPQTCVRTTRYYGSLTGCDRTLSCCRGTLRVGPSGGCTHVRCVDLLVGVGECHRSLGRDGLLTRESDSTCMLRLETRDVKRICSGARVVRIVSTCLSVRGECPGSCLSTTGLNGVCMTNRRCRSTVGVARGCHSVSSAGILIGHVGTRTCYLGGSCPGTVRECRRLLRRGSDSFRAYFCTKVDCCTLRSFCPTRSLLRETLGSSGAGVGILCCLKHTYSGAS